MRLLNGLRNIRKKDKGIRKQKRLRIPSPFFLGQPIGLYENEISKINNGHFFIGYVNLIRRKYVKSNIEPYQNKNW
jgi:hypothetical protein